MTPLARHCSLRALLSYCRCNGSSPLWSAAPQLASQRRPRRRRSSLWTAGSKRGRQAEAAPSGRNRPGRRASFY